MQGRSGQEVTGETIVIPRPPPPADPLIGRTLGSYRVVRLLGRGGMGAVYLGQHPAIGSRVAIKVLHPRFAGDPEVLGRFFDEARATNLIGHDNIVKVLDFSQAQGDTYLVMEFLDGPTLGSVLKKGRALPLARAGPIALQCCRALQAAHEHKILHRDLKPDNIFLVPQGERADFVKVVDFGVAKLLDSEIQRTQAGMVLGTPAYMSPEQAQAQPLDARSDVYALGVILFQMATGRLPFAHVGRSLPAQLQAAVHETAPRPRTLAPDIPEDYEAIILKALAKKPEDRFQSMAELHDAMLRCLERQGISPDLPRVAEPGPEDRGARHAPRGRGARRSPKRYRLPVIAGLLAGTLAAAGIVGGMRIVVERREHARLAEQRARERAARERAAREAEAEAAAEAERQRRAEEEQRAQEAQARREAEEQEAARRAAQKKPAAARKPAEPTRAAEQKPAEPVRLFLVSNPPAHFEASWKGGSKQGETPMQVEVPRDARVRVRYTRAGFAPFELEITASEPQAIPAALKRQ